MKVSKLFTDLAIGELRNLAMADNNTIRIQDRPTVIRWTNEALLSIHTKFVLIEKDVIIEMRDGITNYHLLKKFAMSCYSPTPGEEDNVWCQPYIQDLCGEPFQEDVIKILSVYDSYGRRLPMNDTELPHSIFTPQPDMLQVPMPMPCQALGVEYQARHYEIPFSDEVENCSIYLPKVFYKALTSYIAAKIYSNMNTAENVAKGQEHLFNFNQTCQEVLDRDLYPTSTSTTNQRFHRGGWV